MALNNFKCNHLVPLHFKGLSNSSGDEIPKHDIGS